MPPEAPFIGPEYPFALEHPYRAGGCLWHRIIRMAMNYPHVSKQGDCPALGISHDRRLDAAICRSYLQLRLASPGGDEGEPGRG